MPNLLGWYSCRQLRFNSLVAACSNVRRRRILTGEMFLEGEASVVDVGEKMNTSFQQVRKEIVGHSFSPGGQLIWSDGKQLPMSMTLTVSDENEQQWNDCRKSHRSIDGIEEFLRQCDQHFLSHLR